MTLAHNHRSVSLHQNSFAVPITTGSRVKLLPPIVWLVRLLVGAYPRWVGSATTATQRVYFANHTSHMDTIVLWAALPSALRANTRPVAARDYWDKPGLRATIAKEDST